MTAQSLPSRAEALALVHEYTASDSLRKHMLTVEAVMRAYAEHFGEDPERWGLAGLIHDFDYERYPNAAHSATEEHPAQGVRILRDHGWELFWAVMVFIFLILVGYAYVWLKGGLDLSLPARERRPVRLQL